MRRNLFKFVLLSLILFHLSSFILHHYCFASPAGKVRAGNRHYKKGEFDRSLEDYRDAHIASPNDPVVNFNMGGAHYKLEDMDESERAYSRAAASKDRRIASMANYNLGNAAFRKDKTDEALDYFKKALILDPRDEDAKYNIEYILRRKKAQNKNKDSNKNKERNKDKSKQQAQNGQDGQKENRSGMSKEDAERILRAYNEADRASAKKRKMETPQLPGTDEDW